MVRFTASTRQPPAGGLGSASELDQLLEGLRRGERDGFVRYFELFRTPVYGFVLHLLRDEDGRGSCDRPVAVRRVSPHRPLR